jgi:hypothetical protein
MTYITKICVDRWDGVFNKESEVVCPSIEQIKKMIERLDGRRFTMVILETHDEAHMAIGGGDNGRYIVYATFDNNLFYNLLSSKNSGNMVTLFIGGQEGEYPADTVVDFKSALAAATTYAESGILRSDLRWEKQ